MARRYGRCAKGERLKAPIPYGHWKTTTFLASLCHDGLIAPLALDGPIDGDSFRGLRRTVPGGGLAARPNRRDGQSQHRISPLNMKML
jgi:hypothetical protein